MDDIESGWERLTEIPSSKRWICPVGQAPKRETIDGKYEKTKNERLTKMDNHWYIETKSGLKRIILAPDALTQIREEWKAPNRGKKPFIDAFLAKYNGVRKKDLKWLVDKLSVTRS